MTAGAAAGAADGTAAVDRALLTASLLRQRWGGAAVTVASEPMDRLVGTVTIEESLDNPVPVASFQLLTPRLARHHSDTLSWGQHDVTIDLSTGAPGAMETWEAFVGTTETLQNSGAYVPRGGLRGVSLAGSWAGKLGCVRIGAYSGKRRGQVLHQFATSVGVTIANPEIDSLGAIVNRPLEWNGITLLEAARRLGDVEGWFVRITPLGALEIVQESEVLTGPSIFDFTPDTYFSITETPPTRPVTEWVLSGAYIPESVAPTGYGTSYDVIIGQDDNGPTETRVTTLRHQGVELWKRSDVFRVFARDGTVTLPAVFQFASRTETTTHWTLALFGDGLYHYTTQMTARETDNYEVTGIQSDNTGSLWADGLYYLASQAQLVRTQRDEETWSWWPAAAAPLPHMACTLHDYHRTTSRWYSPISDASGFVYGDGENRVAGAYSWMTFETAWENWTDLRHQAPQFVGARTLTNRYHYVASQAGDIFGLDETKQENWRGIGAGDKHLHTITTNGQLGTNEEQDGPVPGPPVGSVNTAQLTQTVVVDSFDASDLLPFDPLKGSEMIENLEDPAELETIRAGRYRRDLADSLEIRGRIIPGLKLADVVRVTDSARSLSLRRGWVASLRRSQEAGGNGKGEQVTVVKLLPEWPA